MMSPEQEEDGEYKPQVWSLSKWDLLPQTREAGQARNGRTVGPAEGPVLFPNV